MANYHYEVYFDYDIGMTHIAKHQVSIVEIDEVFSGNFLNETRDDGSFVVYARLASGRYLQVSYRKISKNKLFIITANDIMNENDKSEVINYENKEKI